jgi:hypothetical protein
MSHEVNRVVLSRVYRAFLIKVLTYEIDLFVKNFLAQFLATCDAHDVGLYGLGKFVLEHCEVFGVSSYTIVDAFLEDL